MTPCTALPAGVCTGLVDVRVHLWLHVRQVWLQAAVQPPNSINAAGHVDWYTDGKYMHYSNVWRPVYLCFDL